MGIRTKAATPRLCGLFPFEVTCIGKRVVRRTVLLPAWVERAGVKLATRLKCHLGGRTSDSCTVLLKKRSVHRVAMELLGQADSCGLKYICQRQICIALVSLRLFMQNTTKCILERILKEEAIIFCKATLLSWIEAELEGGAGPPLPDVPGGLGVLLLSRRLTSKCW